MDVRARWPALSRDPIDIPELPPRPMPTDLARAYAEVALSLHSRLPQIVEALEWLHDTAEEQDAQLVKILQILRTSRMPLGDTETTGGVVRVPPDTWRAVQERLAQLDEAVEAVERTKLEAEARAQGARDAIAQVEAAADARRRRVSFWLSVATIGGGVVGWLATHVFRL